MLKAALLAAALAFCGSLDVLGATSQTSRDGSVKAAGAVAPSLTAIPADLRSIAAAALGSDAQPRLFATAAAWDAAGLARDETEAAAWLDLFPAFGTYGVVAPCPQLQNACALLRQAPSLITQEPAVGAFLAVVQAEQSGKPHAAIAAMKAASSSVLRDHPVLLNSFALALTRGGPSMVTAAQEAGLPTEARALHLKALTRYPYNPLYWTDLGDYYLEVGDQATAAALYSVALALPSPGAKPESRHPVLAGKAARLRRLQ